MAKRPRDCYSQAAPEPLQPLEPPVKLARINMADFRTKNQSCPLFTLNPEILELIIINLDAKQMFNFGIACRNAVLYLYNVWKNKLTVEIEKKLLQIHNERIRKLKDIYCDEIEKLGKETRAEELSYRKQCKIYKFKFADDKKEYGEYINYAERCIICDGKIEDESEEKCRMCEFLFCQNCETLDYCEECEDAYPECRHNLCESCMQKHLPIVENHSMLKCSCGERVPFTVENYCQTCKRIFCSKCKCFSFCIFCEPLCRKLCHECLKDCSHRGPTFDKKPFGAWKQEYIDDIREPCGKYYEVTKPSPLCDAIKKADKETFNNLIAKKCDLEALDKKGRAPLHVAAKKGYLWVVQDLLKAGANVESKVPLLFSPIMLAASKGHISVVEELLKAGADLTRFEEGNALLHAVRGGNSDIVNLLLPKYEPPPKACDSIENTTLHVALFYGHAEIARSLLDQFISLRDEINVNKETPLHLAAEKGFTELLTDKLLLREGDINKTSIEGETPLHYAAKGGNAKTVELLLTAGAEVDTSSMDGYTPLHFASEHNHVDVVKLLIQKGAKVDCKSLYGETPLSLAALCGSYSVIETLKDRGADLEIRVKEKTPLFLAAEGGHLEAVKKLLELGANVSVAAVGNMTPLHAAAKSGHVGVIQELLKGGANIDAIAQMEEDEGESDDEKGEDEEEEDEEEEDEEAKRAEHEDEEEEDFELERCTPARVATVYGKRDAHSFLLKAGAQVSKETDFAWIPLLDACRAGNLEQVQKLVEKGADLQTHNYYPLKLAIRNKNLEIMRTLIQHGALKGVSQQIWSQMFLKYLKNGMTLVAKELLNAVE